MNALCYGELLYTPAVFCKPVGGAPNPDLKGYRKLSRGRRHEEISRSWPRVRIIS